MWDPRTGEQLTALGGHQHWVHAVCMVTFDGHALLASGGDDRTIRVWDVQTGTCRLTVPVRHRALSLADAADSLAVGLDGGIS